MAVTLICLPLVAALLVWLMKPGMKRARVLPVVGILHLGLVIWALTHAFRLRPDAWLRLDPLGGWVLLVVSVLFCLCALYAPAYMALRRERDFGVFSACMLLFLGMASLVATSRHPAVLWVGMEAMTLSATPLIYYNHNRRSLEATWKYLLLGSVGMALALLGTFFTAYAAQLGGLGEPLYFDHLVPVAQRFSVPWLKVGFVFILVGYGTKMGLAPLHAWKPDAYGETPGIVGAILAGGVTSCAFLALLRMFGLVAAAGQADFARDLLVGAGLLSMAWAALFMIRQNDLKRLLAYSSVEHMGILVFGLGIGGMGTFFALLHIAANALVKGVLFLSTGNIQRAYDSRTVPDVSGAFRRMPVSASLLFLGFAAITATPPFAPFVSVFGISAEALRAGRGLATALFLALLGIIFLGMGSTLLPALQGQPRRDRTRTPFRDTFSTTAPVAGALLLALLLGLWMPRPVDLLLKRAASMVEGRTVEANGSRPTLQLRVEPPQAASALPGGQP